MHTKSVSSIYKDYPEQPYISPKRDLDAWVKTPERFPYGKVAKAEMTRLDEGLLPGHIVMLWRVGFGSFTTESVIPSYFEYRYGVEATEVLNTLMDKGYIELCDAKDSLYLLNAAVLKRILKQHGLPAKGKKDELLQRMSDEVPQDALAVGFEVRAYRITPSGTKLLTKYDNIIQKHGPKM